MLDSARSRIYISNKMLERLGIDGLKTLLQKHGIEPLAATTRRDPHFILAGRGQYRVILHSGDDTVPMALVLRLMDMKQ
ncbi:MAG: hypothetical protein V3S68_06910 [Dehalococcoidia bacterium]